MKETNLSDEQIVKILREAENGEQKIAALCRAHGVHETTLLYLLQAINRRINWR